MTVIWELDFYSRPVLDEKQKKLWEILICETPLTIDTPLDSLFRFSKFCANTQVNSVTLRDAIAEAIAQAPQPPDKIRFFRRQMSNMITKGCDDAGIPAYASRRTLALNRWIQDRMETVYPTMPNYQASASPSVMMPPTTSKPLPDALLGQRWAFVTLSASDFADMPDWDIGFGEAFPLALADLNPDTKIPGVLIFSERALPLAAWMSGLELAALRVESSKTPRLLLETGADESWILALLPNATLQTEAQTFEQAKGRSQRVHFIAVQDNPEAEAFAGFWLMQELDLA